MKTSMNNKYSVWYNSYGIDECYGRMIADSPAKALLSLSEKVSFIEGVEFKEFEKEFSGEGWIMYAFDGVGLFEVEESYDEEECYEEYDKCIREAYGL